MTHSLVWDGYVYDKEMNDIGFATVELHDLVITDEALKARAILNVGGTVFTMTMASYEDEDSDDYAYIGSSLAQASDGTTVLVPWTFMKYRKQFSGVFEAEAFVVGPEKIGLQEARTWITDYAEEYIHRTAGPASEIEDGGGFLTPLVQHPNQYVRGYLGRSLPAQDAIQVEIVGYYALGVGGYSQPYTIRTALNSNYWSSDWRVRKVTYQASMRSGQGGLFVDSVYPNPPHTQSQSWAVTAGYKDFNVKWTYTTSSNSYVNAGYYFDMELAGNWAVQDFVWNGQNVSRGSAMTMKLQMVQGSTVGVDYYGDVTKADIYLSIPFLGMHYWVQSGTVPFVITAN